jgi:lysine-N-methylase
VTFDEAACRKYEGVAAGPLRDLLEANVERLGASGEGTMPPKAFARVRLDKEHRCPFLTKGKLCRIQAEHGAEFLSVTCATYPRMPHRIDGLEETGLSLSCPEAARLVLGTEDLAGFGNESQYRMRLEMNAGSGNAGREKAGRRNADVDPRAFFWPVREFVLRVLTNRSYAVWQRLFLVGVFVRELAGMGKDGGRFGALLKGFSAAMDTGSFRESMEAIEPDLRNQLDVVLRLAGLRLPRTCVGGRFVETLEQFTEGIGNGPGVSLEDLIRGYGRAYRKYYEPYMETHPLVLENLLINAVFRGLFPFGTAMGSTGWQPAFEREFALLALQFALLKGLLIGVAGFHRRRLAEPHVIQTVQAVSKHFEHHPAFLDEAFKLLEAGGLNTPRGLTMLIRN